MALKTTLMSALVLLVYDHVLSFDDEVTQIWNVRQSASTISFLVARYITPPLLFLDFLTFLPIWTPEYEIISHEPASYFWFSCRVFNLLRVLTVTVILTTLSAQIAMTLRVYALYGVKTFVLVFLLFVLLIEALLMLVHSRFWKLPSNPQKINYCANMLLAFPIHRLFSGPLPF
ncbi:hypothetical protein K439DRAFT_856162 [Ramaria rubella]|nr:hypothetical protein K439DRAFT_856162 [Ramaria rubella]